MNLRTEAKEKQSVLVTDVAASKPKEDANEIIDLTSQLDLQARYEKAMNDTLKVIASKDAEIETLEHYLTIKEAAIIRSEQMNKDLIGKVDDLMSFQTEKVDEILAKVGGSESAQVKRLEEAVTELTKTVTELQSKLANQDPTPTDNSTEPGSGWMNDCQDVLLGMAQKLEKIEVLVESNQSKEEVMVITDSNGKHFRPSMLHHEKKVVMENIFTLEAANNKIPKRENPEAVKDIVFMTGLNDSKDHRTSVEEIVNRQKQACHLYHHQYKKAKFHIVAVAPKSLKQRNLNKRLLEYATSAGVSFVSNDALIDEQTGEVKEGMLEEYHYTPEATSVLAKELKHSLYGNKPAQHQRPPTNQVRPQQGQPRHQQQHQQQPNRPPLLPLPSTFGAQHQFTPNPRNFPLTSTNQRQQPMQNNAWPRQNSMLPPSSAMQPNPNAIEELLSTMDQFLQKWKTLPDRGS